MKFQEKSYRLVSLAVLVSMIVSTAAPVFADDKKEEESKKSKEMSLSELDEKTAEGRGLISTGSSSVLSAFVAFNLGGSKAEENAAFLSSLGIASSFLGATTVSSAAGLRNTRDDVLLRFRETKTYTDMVAAFGERKAESILLDIYSGWDFKKVIAKHVVNKEEAAKLIELWDRAQAEAAKVEEAKKANVPAQAQSDAQAKPVNMQPEAPEAAPVNSGATGSAR